MNPPISMVVENAAQILLTTAAELDFFANFEA